MPRRLVILFVLGLEVAKAQASDAIISALSTLPFLGAMAALAARIWQATALPSAVVNSLI